MVKTNKGIVQMITDYDGDINSLIDTIPSSLSVPLLATRDLVVFPGIATPILIGRRQSLALVDYLRKNRETVFAIFSQIDSNVENPNVDDLQQYGVYAKMIRVLEIPGNEEQVTLIVQAMGRCSKKDLLIQEPFSVLLTKPEKEEIPSLTDKEFILSVNLLRESATTFIRRSESMPDEAALALTHINYDILLVNHLCTSLPISLKRREKMLAESSYMERITMLLRWITKELERQDLLMEIKQRTRADLDEQQKAFFLQQEMRNIKEELGEGDGSADKQELIEKAAKKQWSTEVAKVFERELHKLDILHPQSPDYSVQLTYLQTMVSLPWGEYTVDNLNLDRAAKILDKEHYGMEKVKERILEYLAVLKQRGDLKSPIICLYGPPGVGKTSLGKSIAESLERKYVRVSLGGLHDESEIRGHRRTYVGAMPGRIVKNIQKAGSSNPVFILDEIDKVTQNTINGDPSSALLEVLDPEQNKAFHDNYLDIDYDLSKVMFIATANDLGPIPRALLDRMEVIEVSGYVTEEKVEIAKRHLVPRELKNTGFDQSEDKPSFPKNTLERIVEQYTRESGVRQLEKQINKVLRKMAFIKATQNGIPYKRITPDHLKELLGKQPFFRDIYEGNDNAGVVTGLAWTSVGGEILFIETSLSRSKQAKLTLTGNLGDVMKESAVIALEYVKAHANLLNIDARIFDEWNIHIHVPEGATPKDGPSAGITIATSIASAITQRKVRCKTAMTGEITLQGKVLPVGGIKEKILAAKRAGITDIVMSQENEKDIEEIPTIYLKGLNFHYVKSISQVWDFALTDELVDLPVTFIVEPSVK